MGLVLRPPSAPCIDRLSCNLGVAAADQLCRSSAVRNLAPAVIALLGLALLLASFVAAAAWALRPVAQLADAARRLGPQNLGERAEPRGSAGDELRILPDALNDMLDRIADSYEGQRRFAANASHELRTPLAIQRTLIEVSMDGPLSGEELGLLTRQLLRTNERNEQLIEGLLVLSESDRGLTSTSPQRLDLIAAEVLAAHRELAGRAGVALDGELAEHTVAGERVLLERLVTNLVQNAVKYNHAGGRVRVAVGTDPSLTVTNTGPEVPRESIAGLFEPFRRLSRDRVSQAGGAGLGLTIARSIVQAHHGTIRAEPGPEGGLEISVRLPGSRPAP